VNSSSENDSSENKASTQWTVDDQAYMAEALRLAETGLYTTEPNPRVGCILVRDGKIVGRGWHQKAGSGHAEVNALAEAGDAAKGATAYVTLEPCSHYGRTPPCADALIKAQVRKVIAAMKDPNPEVSGRGFEKLEAAGIKTASGLLAEPAKALNVGFVQRMEKHRPFVRIKMAISVDGRTAMQSGESQWITGPAARSDVQRLRARSSAVLTGIGTLLQDDAALTLRANQLGLAEAYAEEIVKRQPLRVVLDSLAKMPADSKLLSFESPVLWVVNESAITDSKISELAHVELFRLAEGDSQKRLPIVLAKLADLGCNELLVEAGATLAGSFIEAECWDELVIYMAPKLLGSDARALANLPISRMSEAKDLILKDVRQVGDDIRLTYRPKLAQPSSNQ